ncbi:hypothetical protein XENOCAPTIV_009224 [Xenoophorus captivus]|uniref:Uncharacterized protein n=1 Tax=Xenoophorus captivus TaxID=1517983 RepID=A0ABV0Q9W7_9TELE
MGVELLGNQPIENCSAVAQCDDGLVLVGKILIFTNAFVWVPSNSLRVVWEAFIQAMQEYSRTHLAWVLYTGTLPLGSGLLLLLLHVVSHIAIYFVSLWFNQIFETQRLWTTLSLKRWIICSVILDFKTNMNEK